MKVFSVLLVLVFAATASASLVEDFESYADTAEMNAVWGAGPGTLDTATGNPGQSMLVGPGATGWNSAGFADMSDDPQAIVFEFDMLDPGLGNMRMGGRLQKDGWGWFDIGLYNNPAGYAFREVGGLGWTTFPTNPAVRPGWHTFRIIITPDSATYEADLAESVGYGLPAISVSHTVARAGASDFYNAAQFGYFDSSQGSINIDNVSVTNVPEPATLTLLAFGAVALIRRRR